MIRAAMLLAVVLCLSACATVPPPLTVPHGAWETIAKPGPAQAAMPDTAALQ